MGVAQNVRCELESKEDECLDTTEGGRYGRRRATRKSERRQTPQVWALEAKTGQFGVNNNRGRSARQSEERAKETRVDRGHSGVDGRRTGGSASEGEEKRRSVNGPATAFGTN